LKGGGLIEGREALTYYFAVIGPPDLLIPIDVGGDFFNKEDGNVVSNEEIYVAGATFDADGIDTFPLLTSVCTIPFSNGICLFNGQMHVPTNTVERISLIADELFDVAFPLPPEGGFSDSIVDPIITIDPSFSNPGEFSLQFSAGIGNSLTTVPEPGSLALFGIGLVGLALMRRKRGRSQSSWIYTV
jgi:PEP-CTERM motif